MTAGQKVSRPWQRKLIREIESLGGRVVFGGNGHLKVYNAADECVCSLTGSPSDRCAEQVQRRSLRRAGIMVARR